MPAAGSGSTLVIGTVCCGLVLSALPVFLVGGLAVQIRADLGLTETQLGAAVSTALLTGACIAPFGGRLADRIGARAAVLIGGALSVLALSGIAGMAQRWQHLAMMLAVAGIALSLTDPGLAIILTRALPATRQGLAFGFKESSIPAATLIAGLAVPLVALTYGWRWAFAVGLVPLVGLLLLLPRVDLRRRAAGVRAPARRGGGRGALAHARRPPRSALVCLAGATALGTTAASGVGVFLTQSAVAMGLSPASAGLLLAGASLAAIAARIVSGILADRTSGQRLGVVSWMLAAGAAAMALGAVGGSATIVVAAIGVFAAGWGWPGLLFLSLVRASPAAPGAAAGVGVAGLAAGNGIGPLLFGAMAEAVSFRAAWGSAALIATLAALLMRLARSRFLAVPAGPPAAG